MDQRPHCLLALDHDRDELGAHQDQDQREVDHAFQQELDHPQAADCHLADASRDPQCEGLGATGHAYGVPRHRDRPLQALADADLGSSTLVAADSGGLGLGTSPVAGNRCSPGLAVAADSPHLGLAGHPGTDPPDSPAVDVGSWLHDLAGSLVAVGCGSCFLDLHCYLDVEVAPRYAAH